MKSSLMFSLGRLAIALAIFFAAIAPNKVKAIECSGAVYGDWYCVQCWVYSPLGWMPVGDPEWTSASMTP